MTLGASFHSRYLLVPIVRAPLCRHRSPIGHPLRSSVQSRSRNMVSSKSKTVSIVFRAELTAGASCVSFKTRTPPERVIWRAPEAGSREPSCVDWRATVEGSTWERNALALPRILTEQSRKAFAPGTVGASPPLFRGLRSRAKSTNRVPGRTRSLSECSSHPFTRRSFDPGQLA